MHSRTKVKYAQDPSVLFMDSTGWLAIIDPSNPLHEKAVNALTETKEITFVSSDHIMRDLSQLAKTVDSDKTINELIWLVWSGELSTLIRVEAVDERVAWNVYLKTDDVEVSYYHCLTATLLHKYKIKRILHFSETLTKNLQLMLSNLGVERGS